MAKSNKTSTSMNDVMKKICGEKIIEHFEISNKGAGATCLTKKP